MRIVIVGCGVMGGAFAKLFAKTNPVILCDHHQERVEHLAQELHAVFKSDVREAVCEAEVIFLAIKPKDLPDLCLQLKDLSFANKVVVSILAGVSLRSLHRCFPKSHIVRAMPSLALSVGQGVIGLAKSAVFPPTVQAHIDLLFQDAGLVLWLPEEQMNGLTALTGSGIGFFFFLMEGMIEGGKVLGFTLEEATKLVLRTVKGAAALVEHTGKAPELLRAQVSSPEGTTLAGLSVLQQKEVKQALVAALLAAAERGAQLGAES